MRRPSFLAVLFGLLALAACGGESRAPDGGGDASTAETRLYIQVAGMVKALGIT